MSTLYPSLEYTVLTYDRPQNMAVWREEKLRRLTQNKLTNPAQVSDLASRGHGVSPTFLSNNFSASWLSITCWKEGVAWYFFFLRSPHNHKIDASSLFEARFFWQLLREPSGIASSCGRP